MASRQSPAKMVVLVNMAGGNKPLGARSLELVSRRRESPLRTVDHVHRPIKLGTDGQVVVRAGAKVSGGERFPELVAVLRAPANAGLFWVHRC
jgi:hypothetical protein